MQNLHVCRRYITLAWPHQLVCYTERSGKSSLETAYKSAGHMIGWVICLLTSITSKLQPTKSTNHLIKSNEVLYWYRIILSTGTSIVISWGMEYTLFSFHSTLLTPLTVSWPSGELTLEEFIEGAKDHEDIMDMLKKMMDLTPVLVIIVEGREGWEHRTGGALGWQRLIYVYN